MDTCSLKCPLIVPSPNLKQGIESIDQIARLCQSDVEAVRAAARETTLSFGNIQHPAFRSAVGLLGPVERLCQRGHSGDAK